MSAAGLKMFEAGEAYAYAADCPLCAEELHGLLINIIPMTIEERMEARCGKLLLVECDRCENREYAYRTGSKDDHLVTKWSRIYEREDRERMDGVA